jgi:NAD(P)H-flavin reductase
MKQFHPLTIEAIERETRDSLRITLAVPDEFEGEYEFLPGQHLPFEIVVDGKKIRRTYSICSAVDERPLEIGVRIQPGGVFSELTITSRSRRVAASRRSCRSSGPCWRVSPAAVSCCSTAIASSRRRCSSTISMP